MADEKVLRQLDEAAAVAVNAALTDEQKKKWKELLGEPFDTNGFQFQPVVGAGR